MSQTAAPPAPATGRRPARPLRQTLRRAEQLARPLVALTVLLALWQTAVAVWGIDPFLLPAPSDVAAAGREYLTYLGEQTWVTLGHILGGYTIGVAAGVTLAALLSVSSYLRGAVMPLLVGVQGVPKVALAPLLILWLGFGNASKLAMVALLCFFPVVVATITGLRSTPREAVEMARCYRAGRWATLCKIRAWYALPHIFTGLKVAMTLALIGAVVAQLTNPNAGLGAVILRASQQGNMALTFAAVAALALTGISLYYAVTAAERLTLPWNRETTA